MHTSGRSIRMVGATVLLAGVAGLWTGCGPDDRRGADRDAAAMPGTDGGATVGADGSVGTRDGDVVVPGDGAVATGPVSVSCFVHEGPGLVVTRPWDATADGARALARVRLRFDAAATGIAIEEVQQVADDGSIARTWDGARFSAPSGFDGTVAPRDGEPTPMVLFTAVDDAGPEEIALCDVPAVDRNAGTFVVRGRTDQSGAFEVSCSLSNVGLFDSDLRVSCARGVPGFLHGIAAFGDAVEHPIMLAESEIAAYADTSAPVAGLAADGLTVQSFAEDDPIFPSCAAAQTWEAPGGTHQIWRGRTSEDVYGGPIAPGTEESAFYFWQAPGSIPSGFCFPPDTGGDPPECRRPLVQLVVTGTSSAGRWEWEGGVFTCYDGG